MIDDFKDSTILLDVVAKPTKKSIKMWEARREHFLKSLEYRQGIKKIKNNQIRKRGLLSTLDDSDE